MTIISTASFRVLHTVGLKYVFVVVVIHSLYLYCFASSSAIVSFRLPNTANRYLAYIIVPFGLLYNNTVIIWFTIFLLSTHLVKPTHKGVMFHTYALLDSGNNVTEMEMQCMQNANPMCYASGITYSLSSDPAKISWAIICT